MIGVGHEFEEGLLFLIMGEIEEYLNAHGKEARREREETRREEKRKAKTEQG